MHFSKDGNLIAGLAKNVGEEWNVGRQRNIQVLVGRAPVEREYIPDRATVRAGAHRALVQNAVLKRIPSRPMRS